MKSRSLLFGLLLVAASSRADEVMPAWKAIGDDASANAVVRRGAGQSPVRYGDLTRKGSVELPADGPRPRVEWDFKLPCDLSQARGVSFDFRCDDVSGLKGAAFYFKSGGGWYSTSLMIDEEGEWQHVEILKSKVRGVEGNPGGWDKVELFRLALDRGADRKATQAAIADFAVIPQPGEGEIKVAVVQGAWASRQKGAESGAILSYAAQLSSELTRIGVANAIFADETLTEANLRGVKVVALAYNPSLPPSALKVLEAFVARGGRLFVCYSLPQGVSRLIGVRAAAYYRSGQQGDPPIGGLLRSGAGLDGQPAFAPQDSGNSSVPALLGEGEVVATWADALKRPLAGKPALLRTPTGVYMSHVWRPDPRKEKRQLLCAICAALAPELKADFAAAEAARAKLDAEVRAFVKSVPGKAGERRLAWCHNARGLAGHEHDWEYSVRVLKESGFTDLIVNLSWGDRAFYASKVLEVDPSVGTDGDALEQCLAACRKYGVKCHAWKVCYNTGGRIDRERAKRFAEEGRFVKLFSAKSANAWSHTFCPSHPENMKREAKAMVELAGKGGGRHPLRLHPLHERRLLLLRRLPDAVREGVRRRRRELAGGRAEGSGAGEEVDGVARREHHEGGEGGRRARPQAASGRGNLRRGARERPRRLRRRRAGLGRLGEERLGRLPLSDGLHAVDDVLPQDLPRAAGGARRCEGEALSRHRSQLLGAGRHGAAADGQAHPGAAEGRSGGLQRLQLRRPSRAGLPDSDDGPSCERRRAGIAVGVLI